MDRSGRSLRHAVVVHLQDLATPAAVIDHDVLARNCRVMADRMTMLGVRLRPHVKTHKCVEIARLQVAGHDAGVTVSTFAEARAMAAGGIRDVTWAVPVPHPRIGEAVALHRALAATGGRLQLLVDHRATVEAIDAEAVRQDTVVPVFIKVDCGYARAGVDPNGAALTSLAIQIEASAGLALRGVLTHGGHSYDVAGREALLRVAGEERDAVVHAANRLRIASVACAEVSLGSTPTMAVAEDLRECTEARPGNYALFDVFQARIGSCALSDVALSVLVSVIGVYPERGQLLVDGGALAFSKDPGATHVLDGGFGVVRDLEGRDLPLKLVGLSQEHGKMKAVGDSGWLQGVELGTKLRVLPNHACLVTALHPELAVVRGQAVLDRWVPVRGW